jgi:hypothetical protein
VILYRSRGVEMRPLRKWDKKTMMVAVHEVEAVEAVEVVGAHEGEAVEVVGAHEGEAVVGVGAHEEEAVEVVGAHEVEMVRVAAVTSQQEEKTLMKLTKLKQPGYFRSRVPPASNLRSWCSVTNLHSPLIRCFQYLAYRHLTDSRGCLLTLDSAVSAVEFVFDLAITEDCRLV